MERAIAWREGKLVASGQPLSVLVADLDRYRPGRILRFASALGTRRFSGTLDLRDTDDALAVPAARMRLKIMRLTPFLVPVGVAP